jgi:hypothetical protein
MKSEKVIETENIALQVAVDSSKFSISIADDGKGADLEAASASKQQPLADQANADSSSERTTSGTLQNNPISDSDGTAADVQESPVQHNGATKKVDTKTIAVAVGIVCTLMLLFAAYMITTNSSKTRHKVLPDESTDGRQDVLEVEAATFDNVVSSLGGDSVLHVPSLPPVREAWSLAPKTHEGSHV